MNKFKIGIVAASALALSVTDVLPESINNACANVHKESTETSSLKTTQIINDMLEHMDVILEQSNYIGNSEEYTETQIFRKKVYFKCKDGISRHFVFEYEPNFKLFMEYSSHIYNVLGEDYLYIAYDIVVEYLDINLFFEYLDKIGGITPHLALELLRGKLEYVELKILAEEELEDKDISEVGNSQGDMIESSNEEDIKYDNAIKAVDKLFNNLFEGKDDIGYKSLYIDAPLLVKYIVENFEELAEKNPRIALKLGEIKDGYDLFKVGKNSGE